MAPSEWGEKQSDWQRQLPVKSRLGATGPLFHEALVRLTVSVRIAIKAVKYYKIYTFYFQINLGKIPLKIYSSRKRAMS